MTVLTPRHSGQSATVREGLTGKTLRALGDTPRDTACRRDEYQATYEAPSVRSVVRCARRGPFIF